MAENLLWDFSGWERGQCETDLRGEKHMSSQALLTDRVWKGPRFLKERSVVTAKGGAGQWPRRVLTAAMGRQRVKKRRRQVLMVLLTNLALTVTEGSTRRETNGRGRNVLLRKTLEQVPHLRDRRKQRRVWAEMGGREIKGTGEDVHTGQREAARDQDGGARPAGARQEARGAAMWRHLIPQRGGKEGPQRAAFLATQPPSIRRAAPGLLSLCVLVLSQAAGGLLLP